MIDDLFYDKENWERGDPQEPAHAAFIYLVTENADYQFIYVQRENTREWLWITGKVYAGGLEELLQLSILNPADIINAGIIHSTRPQEIEEYLKILGQSYMRFASQNRRHRQLDTSSMN